MANDPTTPSEIPYSIIVQNPSPDLDPTGQPQQYQKFAVREVYDIRGFIPPEFGFVLEFIRQSFDVYGAYRVEIVVGDWSFKAYKSPRNG